MPATTHLEGARNAYNEARELWAGRGDRKCVWSRCVFFGMASGRHARPPATAVPGTAPMSAMVHKRTSPELCVFTPASVGMRDQDGGDGAALSSVSAVET